MTRATEIRCVRDGNSEIQFPQLLKLGEFDIEVPYAVIPHKELGIKAFPNPLVASAAAADRLIRQARECRDGAIMWPTGRTWELIYDVLGHWVRQNPKDNPFPGTFGYEVDQYVGCGPNDLESFNRYHSIRVQEPLKIHEFNYINGLADDPNEEAKRIGQLLARHRHIASVCLGVDPKDGHIGFILPGTPLTVNYPHVAHLSSATQRRDTVDRGQRPHDKAITVGYNMLGLDPEIQTVDSIILAAWGSDKGAILNEAWYLREPTVDIPVSMLRIAPTKPEIFLDAEAALQLAPCGSNTVDRIIADLLEL